MKKENNIRNRIGEINYNKFGSKMKIIEYRKANDIDVYFEEYDWTYYHTQYHNFLSGSISCPYEPRVYGIGYLGEGIYKYKKNGKLTKCYNVWNNMLMRCYSENFQIKNLSYKDCEVCKEWLNFQRFSEWFENNYYEIEGQKMQLDKDIINKGNKIYSPSNCVFVPQRINELFIKSNKIRGNLPIGVCWSKDENKFIAQVSLNNKPFKIGRFKTKEEAFQSYKNIKEKIIKEIAEEYKPYIPKELYEAMYRYEVEITD